RVAVRVAGGGRRRVVAERVEPEQFVEPVLTVVGEHAVGREAFLAVAHLSGVLDQIEAVEIDACGYARGGGTAGVPARGIDRLLAGPFTGERRKPLVLFLRFRRGETVLGHR